VFEFDLDTSEKAVSLVAGLIAIAGVRAWNKRSQNESSATNPNSFSNNTVGNQIVTLNVEPASPASRAKSPEEKQNVVDLKRTTNILFIDDDRGFKIVGVLKKMGWEHTKLVTDITSLEQPNLLESHVVFVDIQGVGRAMQYSDEGLGLALAIKRRYPTKRVVIYSAEENGARFHEALQEADYSLPKTAEPIRFEDTIVRVLTK
jgi:hypothetical protein